MIPLPRQTRIPREQRPSPYVDLGAQTVVPSSFERDYLDALDAVQVRRLLLEDRSGTPFWGNDPGLYDTVRLAKNIFLPGLCRIRGKCFKQRLQRDKPPGSNGQSVKQLGMEPAKFEIVVKMWTAEHLEAFEKLVPVLKSQRHKTVAVTETVTDLAASRYFDSGAGQITTNKSVPVGPAPIDIYHPWLALFHIRAVHIVDLGFPEWKDDYWEVDISCEEHVANRLSAVKKADSAQDLLIVEPNKRVGATAASLAQQQSQSARTATKKPSQIPQSARPTSGVSGSW